MSREDEAHLMSGQCTMYGDLTKKYSDLTNNDNLVRFTDILARREELGMDKKSFILYYFQVS